jgi:RNA polymerase sigma-70 factor (ECF subfamily)
MDFDGAVRRMTPRLQRYATRRLGDEHEAEELVQEALLRAYKNRDELLTEDDLAAWSTVVLGRLVIDRLRVRGRSINVADVPEGSRVGRDTADVVVARDEARMALDALDAMPARQAAVLWAREVEGQGYDEIGKRFGMTEPAVRSILTRARKALRAEYALRGGTLPVAGLSAIAPWVVGLHWADRLRRAVGRMAAPAAVGALGIGLVGGALTAPGLWASTPTPAPESSVVNQAQTQPQRTAALPGRQHAAVTSHAAVAPITASRPVRVHTVVEDGVRVTCTSRAGAGAGNETCTPGTGFTHYLTPTLPDNPTGIREIGLKTNKLDCKSVPATPLTSCSATPSTGGTP